jgi:hypothetical protein
MIQMTFTKAIIEHFPKRPGQTGGDYLAEIKALTPQDREYFKAEFAKIGIEVTLQVQP